MSVQLRGKKFHYRFQLQGIGYSGVCPGCEVFPEMNAKEVAAVRKRAMQFEAAEKSRVIKESRERNETEREIRRNKTVRALVENYRYELTGGSPIPLAEAFPLAEAKPAKRRAESSYAALRKTYWDDFTAFMTGTYPEIRDLANVRRLHCEAYIAYLTKYGRFVKEVAYNISGKRKRIKAVSYTRDYALSAKTIKEIISVVRWVFSRLEEDAGLLRNPWESVVIPKTDPIKREVFTHSELVRIWEGIQNDDFLYTLFFVSANSGLTEGDICTLKWNEIDWVAGYLRRKRRKTGVAIKLPLLPELAAYFRQQPHCGEYIFPSHAEMYLRQPSCVSARVKDFLHGLGIVTTVEVPGRRAVSIKDLHSMRHVFCYRAKHAGIPESVIKKFVGHAVLAMTEHYADHDTDDELRQEIKKLPALFAGEPGTNGSETEPAIRRRFAELAYSLPLDQIHRLLATLEPENPLPAAAGR